MYVHMNCGTWYVVHVVCSMCVHVCYVYTMYVVVTLQLLKLFPKLRKSRHTRRRATKKRECDQWLSVGTRIARLEKIPR